MSISCRTLGAKKVVKKAGVVEVAEVEMRLQPKKAHLLLQPSCRA